MRVRPKGQVTRRRKKERKNGNVRDKHFLTVLGREIRYNRSRKILKGSKLERLNLLGKKGRTEQVFAATFPTWLLPTGYASLLMRTFPWPCATIERAQKNAQFQHSGVAVRQWGWDPALINAELIYNLMLLCFKIRYQKRTTQRQASNFFCQQWKTIRKGPCHWMQNIWYWERVTYG